ncbi:MAG: hypothetical protein AB2777_16655 [Candidatus Thiodiazotropha endolucinida]
MCIEEYLVDHKIWIDVLTAIGTVSASIIALVLAVRSWLADKRELLSGLKISEIDENGVAYLENTTKRELQFSVYKNNDFVNHLEIHINYRDLLKKSELSNINWNLWKENMVLSPGELIAIHLKSLVVQNTYIALSAIKVVLSQRTRIWVFRFAGSKVKEHDEVREQTHPHKVWVLEHSSID